MWTGEKKAVLLDWQNRRIISSLQDFELPEKEFPEEEAWRAKHTQCHHRREVLLILSGHHSLSFKEKTFLCGPNTLLLLDSLEKHDAKYFPGCPPSAHLWLIIRPDFINCQGDEIRDGKFEIDFRYIFRDKAKIEELNRVWDSAIREKIPRDVGLFALQAQLNLIFFEFLCESAELNVRGLGVHAEAIEKVKSYLDTTSGRGCSIAFLASLAGYSPMHFQRLFRAATGMRVGDYIDAARLRRYDEMQLLCSQKLIAEELGFSSASSFSNWRRKMRRKQHLPDSK